MERRVVDLPFVAVVPFGLFELVLHIEEPDAQRRRSRCRWQEDHQDWGPAAKVIDAKQNGEDTEVGTHGAEPIFLS